MNRFTGRLLLTGLSAAVLVAAATSARASYTLTYEGTVIGGTATIARTANVAAGTAAWSGGVYATMDKGKLNDGSTDSYVYMYCVDIDHWSEPSSNPTEVNELLDVADGLQFQDYNRGVDAADKLDRAKAVRYLIDNYLPASGGGAYPGSPGVTAVQALKTQLAIWEILADGSSISMAAGNFTSSSNNLGVTLADIDTWATTAWTNRNTVVYQSYLIRTEPGTVPASAGPQDYAFRDASPIPEPAFFQMAGLLGLGVLPLLRRRARG